MTTKSTTPPAPEPSRRVYFVDVGEVSPEKVVEYVERVRGLLQQPTF